MKSTDRNVILASAVLSGLAWYGTTALAVDPQCTADTLTPGAEETEFGGEFAMGGNSAVVTSRNGTSRLLSFYDQAFPGEWQEIHKLTADDWQAQAPPLAISMVADKNRTVDGSNLHLRDLHPQPHQGICADMIATLDGFTREDVDALAVESQRRAKNAIDNGHFDKSLITVTNDDGTVALDREEFPRPGTTMESLAGLDTVFDKFMGVPIDDTGETFDELVKRKYPDLKINHVHHAGNSSGVVDGAAALILSNKEYADQMGWKPRARIRAIATVGGDPTLMLNEPGPAARKVLARAGMTTNDIDLFEVNEAFSVVAAKFIRDLELDPEIVNVNGGAMALGHPIGATGSILIGTALDEIERRDLNTALITMCTGGGMAPAIIIERV